MHTRANSALCMSCLREVPPIGAEAAKAAKAAKGEMMRTHFVNKPVGMHEFALNNKRKTMHTLCV